GGAHFLEVGAGDEHARLAAAEDQSAQVAALAELRQDRLEVGLNGLAEDVGPAAGLVEGDLPDDAVEDVEPQGGRGGGHGASLRSAGRDTDLSECSGTAGRRKREGGTARTSPTRRRGTGPLPPSPARRACVSRPRLVTMARSAREGRRGR